VKRKLLLVILLSCACQVAAQDTLGLNSRPDQPFFHSGWGRALMSAAIPGSAQLVRHEWLRGGVFLGAESFLAANAISFWNHQNQNAADDHPSRLYDHDFAIGLATWYGLGALFTAADAWYGTTGKIETVPMRAVWHTALFPGWGQLSNGKRWKAAVVFAVQTSLAFGVFTQHERYLYSQARDETDLANFYKDDRNRLVWWSAGLLMLSCADAYVDCHLRDWNVSPDLSLTPTYFPREKTAGLALQWVLK
jgi:hypothetical protein